MLDRKDGQFRGGGWASGDGKILRYGLKCTTPRLVYASLVASERKLRMTGGEEFRWLSISAVHDDDEARFKERRFGLRIFA